MSLLTIVQTALQEIGDTEVPTSVVGNVNETAIQCYALANRALKETARRMNWPDLTVRATITTVASQEEYALPSDFKSIINQSMWDETEKRYVTGPVTPQDWEYFKNSDTVATSYSYFRIFKAASGNDRVVKIFPVPDSVRTLRYEYRSNALTATSGGTLQAEKFLADTDESIIDEDLILLGLKWRYLKSKGLPYAEEFRDYEVAIEDAKTSTGAPIIQLDNKCKKVLFEYNIPDTGYGL